jgi:hypothetical protein
MSMAEHTSPTNASSSHEPNVHGPEATDPRPHVAVLLELAALGWYVTSIRPDRDAPVLWHVVVERFDRNATISVTDVDPDEALDELLRYASVDEEQTYKVVPFAPAQSSADHVVGSQEHVPAAPGQRRPSGGGL